MNFFIIKGKNQDLDTNILNGILKLHPDTIFVSEIEKADKVVLQYGYTRSTYAMGLYHQARVLKKPMIEGYNFTNKVKVHVN